MNRLCGYKGIIRDKDDLKLYFIEVIEYWKQTACRIFVTTKEYPELKSYDPYKKGGPLYIEKGKFYSNVVEFMKSNKNYEKWHFENHLISFSHCYSPRRGVKVRSLEGV